MKKKLQAKLISVKKLIKRPLAKHIILIALFLAVTLGSLAYHYTSKHTAGEPKAPDSSQIVLPTIDSCAGSNTHYQNTYKCYKGELTLIINQHNPESAVAFLKQQYSTVPYVKSG
jgi:hypothetical protein